MDWPEQTVTIVSVEKTTHVKRLEYKTLADGAKQLRVTVPMLPAGAEAKAIVTLRVSRRALSPPADPSLLALPEKLDAKLRGYLTASPSIESTDAKIQSAAKSVTAGKEGWERAEAIYDWVRANVRYQEGPLKGALQALKDGTGDCEELTSLFIAMCRASKIPARTVWVPGHCYPEFYLVDKAGQGYWIPCQAAGDRSFGGIGELRPILQKGDNFSVPEKPREKVRYVAEFVTGKGGQPSARFIREQVKE
jgi:transglutaminase-like putative cysteine protease